MSVTHRCTESSCSLMHTHEADEWISAAYDRGHANGVVEGIEIGKREAAAAIEAFRDRKVDEMLAIDQPKNEKLLFLGSVNDAAVQTMRLWVSQCIQVARGEGL